MCWLSTTCEPSLQSMQLGCMIRKFVHRVWALFTLVDGGNSCPFNFAATIYSYWLKSNLLVILEWVGVWGFSKVVATFNHVGGSFALFMATTGDVRWPPKRPLNLITHSLVIPDCCFVMNGLGRSMKCCLWNDKTPISLVNVLYVNKLNKD